MTSIANFTKQLLLISTGLLQTLLLLARLIVLPFRFARWCWVLSCGLGMCAIDLVLQACEALIGIALVAAVLFGLGRTLFHPLFA